MKQNKSAGMIAAEKLKNVSELLGIHNEESCMDIEIDRIDPFKNHPFKVLDDEKMMDLVESIKEKGVLSPILIREHGIGRYEVISGHRRLHAAKLCGLYRIPAIIRELTDDEATIVMVDSNIQREELLPSEKAYAFKMKMDAMRHQGITSGHEVQKLTQDLVGETSGLGGRQVTRYIRLTELIPELLDMTDNKRIQFTVAVEISYIDKVYQEWIKEYIHDNGVVKIEQIAALRKRLEKGPISQMEMVLVLNENLKGRFPQKKITLNEKTLNHYFPKDYSVDRMTEIIEQLLEEWSWKKENGGDYIDV